MKIDWFAVFMYVLLGVSGAGVFIGSSSWVSGVAGVLGLLLACVWGLYLGFRDGYDKAMEDVAKELHPSNSRGW